MARRSQLPLTALRAFEAFARLGKMSVAADELCVTNAAVSHQIKQLEDHLGKKLFARRNNQLTLTDAGDNYLPRVRDALRALGYEVEWHEYPMGHSVCMEEIADLNAWLLRVLA